MAQSNQQLHDDRSIARLARNLIQEIASAQSSDVSKPAELLLSVAKRNDGNMRMRTALFPEGIPADEEFFAQLESLRDVVGFGGASDEAIGCVWSEALASVSTDRQESHLTSYLDNHRHEFFVLLGSLPTSSSTVDTVSEG